MQLPGLTFPPIRCYVGKMPGQECYHCRQWIDDKDKKSHDCWTTTEEALTQNLSEDLLDAWQRIREAATELGEQRVYASNKSIMFARKHCYFFVRPQRYFLEVWLFLGRTVKHPLVRKSEPTSKTKRVHLVRVTHRDEVEIPLTDWIREAYEYTLAPKPLPVPKKKAPAKKAKLQKKKSSRRKKRAG